jgi:hypothetical protein
VILIVVGVAYLVCSASFLSKRVSFALDLVLTGGFLVLILAILFVASRFGGGGQR